MTLQASDMQQTLWNRRESGELSIGDVPHSACGRGMLRSACRLADSQRNVINFTVFYRCLLGSDVAIIM